MGQRARIILVADDDPRHRRMIENTILLWSTPCRVLLTADGQQALEVARSELPDLVVLDDTVPNLDGHSVCRVLKSDPATRNIKVILLAYPRPGQQDGTWLGPDACVAKPFRPLDLLAAIKALL